MAHFAAFLRGVSPMNAKMAELKLSFESAGFTDVKTVLSSGNVLFSAHDNSETALARQAEAAMLNHLGRTFYTIVRPVSYLRDLVAADPYAAFDLPGNAKRVVTFLGEPYPGELSLPIKTDDVLIFATNRSEVYSAYVPNPRGPLFMTLIEKNFGRDITTRTWETVKKCINAA